MKLSLFILCTCFWLCILAIPTPRTHVVHETRDSLHPRWIKRDRVPSNKLFSMRIGLVQNKLHNGHAQLMDISNPRSPNYGKHWTSEEVIEAFRPSNETETIVRDWLIENGIHASRITHTDNKAWFAFHATVQEAEKLLYTEYHHFKDSVTGQITPSCDKYHLPPHISSHVDYVTPGVNLLVPSISEHKKRRRSLKRDLQKRTPPSIKHTPQSQSTSFTGFNPANLSICDRLVTPACIAALYKIPPGTSARPDNTLGIFESLLEFYYQPDLDSFFTNFTSSLIPNGTRPIAANIDGGLQDTPQQLSAGGEVTLDLMLAYPIIWPQTVTNYDTDDLPWQSGVLYNESLPYGGGFNEFFDAIDGSYCTFSAFNQTGNDDTIDPVYPDTYGGGWTGKLMCGVYKPTNVISVSYGGGEQFVPIAYQRRQCLEFMKLGLQGVSIIFSSGDAGVGDYPNMLSETGCLGTKQNVFDPQWPVNCPYITGVGATKIYPGHNINDSNPESAAFDPKGQPYRRFFASGGGFSNIYPAPDYQADAVATYFSQHDPGYPYYSAIAPNTTDPTEVMNVTTLAGGGAGLYNRIGRGIPDVSAIGDNIAVYLRLNDTFDGGTSASAPIFASIINRIVEERLNAGKGALGFLNPALYANPSMFNDIINGSNPQPNCNTTGFSAVPGWDPVTGLGTPRYPDMLSYFMGLP